MPSAAASSKISASTNKSTRPMQAVLILSALYFLARFTGLLQSAVISATLSPHATDAYMAAFDLPDFLFYLVAGGALSSTFIPIFTEFWERGHEADAWRFFSTLATVMGTLIAVVTLVMMALTKPLILLTKPGLARPENAETLQLAVQMTRIILPAQLFFYLGALLVGVLNTFKRFGASGWTGATYNIIALGVAVPLYYLTRNEAVFAWGIFIGAFGGTFLLPLIAANSGPAGQRPRFRFRFDPSDPAIKRFFLLALPIMFGVSLPVVDQWVVGFFASNFDAGTLTHLRNGNRLMIALQGVVGQAAAVAAFPYLASEGALGDFKEFSNLLRTGLRRLLFVTLPLTVLMVLWARPLVRLVYGWGEYNDPGKINSTALCFTLFTLGLYAWGGLGFVARGFYALGDTRTPTIIGSVLTFILFVPLCWIAAHTGHAYLLALATTAGAGAHFLTVLVALESKLKGQSYKAPIYLQRIGGTALRTTAACVPMAGAGWLVLKLTQSVAVNDKLGDIFILGAVGAVASVTFAYSAEKFRIPEWFWMKEKFLSRAGRKRAAAVD